MEISIKNKKENNLIGRVEVNAQVAYGGATPSNDTIQKEFAKNLTVDESLVIVKHIYSIFGKQQADVVVFAYKDKKTLEQFEKPVEKKEEPKAEDKPAEAKAEEKPAKEEKAPAETKEAPKEEKKEEPKAEEPKAEKPVEAKTEQ